MTTSCFEEHHFFPRCRSPHPEPPPPEPPPPPVEGTVPVMDALRCAERVANSESAIDASVVWEMGFVRSVEVRNNEGTVTPSS